MKTHYVADVLKLALGERVQSLFRLSGVKQCQKKNGSPYLRFQLVDRTGSIEAKWWSCSHEEHSESQQFRYAKITGTVDVYKGQKEITVSSAEWSPEPDDSFEYEMVASLPLTILRERLEAHIASVQAPHLNSLLRHVFDDEKFRSLFDYAPAAQYRHHACRYGLLQHTLEVTDLTASMAAAQRSWGYIPVSRDLAVAGALLHDVGKIKELTWTQDGEYGASRFGELIGHIMIGVQWVNNKINGIKGFPIELREALLHIITSHHGKTDYGSPIPPKFVEAQIVHAADLLNVQLFYMQEAAQSAKGDFVKVGKLEDRRVYTRSWELMNSTSENRLKEPTVTYQTEADDPKFNSGTVELRRVNPLPLFRFRTAQEPPGGNAVFQTRHLPLVGRAAAGLPKFAEDHVEGYYDVEDSSLFNDRDIYLLRVEGDSMTGDGIQDNDVVVVRRQEQLEKDEVAVVFLDEREEAAIKRVRYNRDGTVSLLSSNPAYAPLEISDPNSIHVCGRVLGLLQEAETTAR